MEKAAQFFYEHGGYSFNPSTETAEQGRARCAESLASAERYALSQGFTFEWADDWSVGDHVAEFGDCYKDGGPQTCESCVCRDADGNVLASLGCIDDANTNYRRVIEAELASEGMDAYQREHAAVNA